MKRFVWLITLCLLLMITPSSYFSENAQGGLEESNMWGTIPCDYSSTEVPTALASFNGYLWIGTAETNNHAQIYRYDSSTDTCEAMWDSTDYYIYAMESWGSYLFFGSRETRFASTGNIWYTDGTTLTPIPTTIWYNDTVAYGGWVQDIHYFSGTSELFFSGTIMHLGADNEGENNFWVKTCDTQPCNQQAHWNWTNQSRYNLGVIDDGLILEDYAGTLFLGTYDFASVLRFYPSNDSWFYSLNESSYGYVDGVPFTTATQGIYSLHVLDDCLHVVGTYAWGLNWTMCGAGGTWASGNITQNSQVARGIVFGKAIYYGVKNSSDYQRIGSFNNITHNQVFQDSYTDFFGYFEEFDSELYATNQHNLYVRHSKTVAKIRITSPTGAVNGMVRLTATVLTDRDVKDVKMVLAEYDHSFTLFKDPKRPVYYYEWFDTERYADGYYHFVARLNSTDGSSSWDNASFEIVNSRSNHLKEQPDGSIKVTHQIPWVPRGDELPGPDYFVGLRYNDPYYIQVAHITESSSNPSTVHASYQPYDLNENDVEVTADIMWLSEVGDSSRTWTNATASTDDTSDDTILKNATGVSFVVLGGENITVQGDGYLTFSFIRQSTVLTVNTVLWKEENDGSYTAHVDFYNNHTEPHDYTVFFVGLAEDRLTNDPIPMNPYKTTMYDYHNGLYLDMGIEYTVSHGGYWFAITGFPSASHRPFTFNYFPDTGGKETELLLIPYCEYGYHDPERPIKCLAEHHQEGPQGFQGTIRFDLSQIRSYGKIDWNKVTLIDDANNLILKRGVDWYPSGFYEITLVNQEIEVSERVKFEIQVGVLERDPLELVEDIDIGGVICLAMGIPLLIATVYYFREATNSRGYKKKTATYLALSFLTLLILIALFYLLG